MLKRILASLARALARFVVVLIRLPGGIMRAVLQRQPDPVVYAAESEARADEHDADVRAELLAEQIEERRKIAEALLAMQAAGTIDPHDERLLEPELHYHLTA